MIVNVSNKRIEISHLTKEDSSQFIRLAQIPEVAQGVGFNQLSNSSLIEGMFNRYVKSEWSFAIRDGNEIIGIIILLESINMRMEPDNTKLTVSYFMDPKFWGHGIMTASVQQVVHLVAHEKKVTKIDAEIFLNNRKSSNLVSRLGFKNIAKYHDPISGRNKALFELQLNT